METPKILLPHVPDGVLGTAVNLPDGTITVTLTCESIRAMLKNFVSTCIPDGAEVSLIFHTR